MELYTPVIHDASTAALSLRKIGAGNCLPGELLAAILERVPVPVVVERCSDDVVFLNAQAHSLWPATDSDSSKLPVTVNGIQKSLLTLHSISTNDAGPTVTLNVRSSEGEPYEVQVFPWKYAVDSPGWRVTILRPLDCRSPEGGLLRDKVDRLKVIVHELRNTLTAAREALSLLQEGAVGELNPEQHHFLSSAMEDLERLIRAMVDLTSLWVTQAGVLGIMLRPVDIRRVVEQTTLCVRPTAEKRGISLHVEIGDPSPVLTGDPELLGQALRNVLTNALQHTSAGGEIRVRAFMVEAAISAAPNTGGGSDMEPLGDADAKESVVIEVQDSGPGIGPRDQERVFEPFERGNTNGSDTGSPSTGGMGLGLTIARDIAWTHGGTLRVRSDCIEQSSPNKGSCFVFEFPKSQTWTCARSWMVRAIQRAIDDVRPLRVSLASVLVNFEADPDPPGGQVQPDLLSTLQQVAVQNLRPTDTVLAIEGQLLMLMRGGTQCAAYAMVDRILESLPTMFPKGASPFGGFRMMFGVAAYPDDGDSAEMILERLEAELRAFPPATDPKDGRKP